MKIDYQLIRQNRRSMSLQITDEGGILVKAPKWLPQFEIERFVNSKEAWIEKALGKLAVRNQRTIKHSFQNGDLFYYLGLEYPIVVDDRANKKIVFKQAFVTRESSVIAVKKLMLNWYKSTAKDLMDVRLMVIAQQNNFTYSKYRITSAKTRWGSCSGQNVVSLNWKLIMMPLEILDYVIVHELCHTVHHNHSAKFWGLVETITPDWKVKRKWLKDSGYKFAF